MLKINTFNLVQKFINLNWTLIGLIVAMSMIGFAMLYSAAEGSFSPWAWKQMLRFMVFFPIMIAIALVNVRFWLNNAYIIYGIVLVSLVMVEFLGFTALGATRWIKIGSFTLQPSEIMKVCMVFALARYFHTQHPDDIGKIHQLFVPILIIALPALLILKQPDLGTAMIIIMLGGLMFFVAGVKWWKFAIVFVGSIASLPIIWQNMHNYQKKRVLTFLNPDQDQLGDGYNILQSKIAIGSGGMSGKGFLHGSQSQLSFLPEKQTDFIFTMLAEEFGFIGGVTIILIYAAIIGYGIIISLNCRHHFGRLMAMGITGILFLHVFINIGMVMGLLPIVGAPLPLLSYGGTIMITILLAFGMLLNIDLHRDERLTRSGSVG